MWSATTVHTSGCLDYFDHLQVVQSTVTSWQPQSHMTLLCLGEMQYKQVLAAASYVGACMPTEHLMGVCGCASVLMYCVSLCESADNTADLGMALNMYWQPVSCLLSCFSCQACVS